MSKEKQIDEMARIIGYCESTLHPYIECHNKATGCYCIENPCHNQRIADKLYTAGYRKQEWISVDERLPEENGRYLVFIKVSHQLFENLTAVGIIEYNKTNGFILYSVAETVTHWMPLPEAPKIKGDSDE